MKFFKIIYLILALFVSFFIVNIGYAHEVQNITSSKKCISTTNLYKNMIYKKCTISNTIIYTKHKQVNVRYYDK